MVKITNPWLKIPASDYENHMKLVGQQQILSRLTRLFLDKYKPEQFALLGCSTGNGLEHVDERKTRRVIAVDINPEYLKLARIRFQASVKGLKLFQMDVEKDDLNFNNMDLIFAGLLLEYVEPEIVLPKLEKALKPGGLLALVIQKNYRTAFVTPTEYRSLKKLSDISRNVDEDTVSEQLKSCGLQPRMREEIEVSPKKSLVCLSFQKH